MESVRKVQPSHQRGESVAGPIGVPGSFAEGYVLSAGEDPPRDLSPITKLIEKGLTDHHRSLASSLWELGLDRSIDSLAERSPDVHALALEVDVFPPEGAGLSAPRADRRGHIHEQAPEPVFLLGPANHRFDLSRRGNLSFRRSRPPRTSEITGVACNLAVSRKRDSADGLGTSCGRLQRPLARP